MLQLTCIPSTRDPVFSIVTVLYLLFYIYRVHYSMNLRKIQLKLNRIPKLIFPIYFRQLPLRQNLHLLILNFYQFIQDILFQR